MPQGYVKSLNLRESDAESDIGIFENIGGAGITFDMKIFSGNTKRTSVLAADKYSTSGNTIIADGDGAYPFSNRTVVYHNSTPYTVTASDGVKTFELRDANGNPFVPTGDLTRYDNVTRFNLENMDKQRLEVIRDASTNQGGANEEDDQEATGGGATNEGETGIYDLRSIAENYGIIEEGLGIYYYKKSRIPRTFEDSVFDRRINFEGNIRITNDDNITQSETSPGVFIKGPSGAPVRAFSDISNPWSDTTTPNALETTASTSSVYELVLNGPNLILPASQIHSENGDATSYTHKMKVMVKSGSHEDTGSTYETFYILLST